MLRFDAPMMALGGMAIDNHCVTDRFPARSMLAGLIANALGYVHRDAERINALQARITFAARCDRMGREFKDFQTVGLGEEYMGYGWTTRGVVQGRDGSVSTQTHIRYRHYFSDAIYTLAMALAPDEGPTLQAVAQALQEPARALFLGRACCLPASPIFVRKTKTPTLRALLEQEPLHPRARSTGTKFLARWPAWEGGANPFFVSDMRDWSNQVHVGRREVCEGFISVRVQNGGKLCT